MVHSEGINVTTTDTSHNLTITQCRADTVQVLVEAISVHFPSTAVRIDAPMRGDDSYYKEPLTICNHSDLPY
jgi:hypothetical protein